MADLHGLRLAVVGGGVLGLSVALQAAWSGAAVVVHDAALADLASGSFRVSNASAVAAGMLAPAFESAIDPVASQAFDLLLAARNFWPAFVERLGLPPAALNRSGAMRVIGPAETVLFRDLVDRMRTSGAAVEVLGAAETLARTPGLAPWVVGSVYSEDDWLIEPIRLLAAMTKALVQAGGRIELSRLDPNALGPSCDGSCLGADRVVIAAGWGARGWSAWAPELAGLRPIKGQMLQLDAGPRRGAVVRHAAGYVVPGADGPVAGATMEYGVSDCELDAAVLERLHETAATLFPALSSATGRGRAGIRAATSDGLPLVGPSARTGVLLATAARRNGWLFAPLVGTMVVAALAGESGDDTSARLHPGRLGLN